MGTRGNGLRWVSRIYCITDVDPEHRKLSQLEAVVRFLTQEDPALECECPLAQARDSVGTEGWVGAGVPCLQSSQTAQGDQRDPLEREDTASPPGPHQ